VKIPDLVDNKKVTSTTLKEVLLDLLKSTERPTLDIATAYINLGAFEYLEEGLSNIKQMRILLGQEPEQTFMFTKKLREELQEQLSSGKAELPGKIKKWFKFLVKENVQIRYYRTQFLHGKAYIIEGVPTIGSIGIVGSSNFTGAGLETNLELNAVLKQESAVNDLKLWFENLWTDAEDYKEEFLKLLVDFTKQYTPYEIYIKILYEALKDKLKKDLDEKDKPSAIALADFQHDGYMAAKEILENYNGVIIADSVGLGKTFLALKLLDDYAYKERETALIICPAALIDTVWVPLLRLHAIPHRIESMEKISQREVNIDEFSHYKVVVIDESHNFRNPRTNRWLNLFEVLRKGSDEKKVILLTATPVNNSVYDLYHQLRLITKDQEDYFIGVGIEDLGKYFKNAEKSRDELYEIMETIAVRRSRSFIRKNYPDALIDGKRIKFPERRLHTVHYSLEESYGKELYEEIAEVIENLLLAPYQLDTFRKDILQENRKYGQIELFESEDRDSIVKKLENLGWAKDKIQDFVLALGRQTALAHIMRVLYLKRLESSIEALKISLKNQLKFQEAFLKCLDQGKFLNSDVYRKLVGGKEEDEEFSLRDDELSELFKTLVEADTNKYDVEAIRAAVNSDIYSLKNLIKELDKIEPPQDDKLNRLREILLQEELKNKKIIIFSYFKDTARYLYRYLGGNKEWLSTKADEHDKKFVEDFLEKLGNKKMSITDSDVTPSERKHRILRFAPRANKKEEVIGSEREIDILISTDVLSEGQNLQDAEVLINYDLHWNPVRMIQRIGRIDRIGSTHDVVYVYNFFPEDKLENLLGLMNKLRKKLDAINKTIGLDASVLGETPNPRDFNTLRRIEKGESAVIDELEEESEVTVGEFLYQDLLEFLKRQGEKFLDKIPLGSGAVRESNIENGLFVSFRDKRSDTHYWVFKSLESGRVTFKKLEAIRKVRPSKDEKGISLQGNLEIEKIISELRKFLVNRLNRKIHRLPPLQSPQNQIVTWLETMPPSNIRNKLLISLSKPVPVPYLKELRKIWKLRGRIQADELMLEFNEFVEKHNLVPEARIEEKDIIVEEDLKVVGWILNLKKEN